MNRKLYIFVMLLVVLSVNGCAMAVEGPKEEPRRQEPVMVQAIAESSYNKYLDVFLQQQPVFLAALDSKNETAPLVVLTATPAAPPNSVHPFSGLRSFSFVYQEKKFAWQRQQNQVMRKQPNAEKEGDGKGSD